MDTQTHIAQTADERLIFRAITLTFAVWFVGGLYLLAPVLGWILLLRLMQRKLARTRHATPIAWPVYSWAIAMLLMLLALIVGHLTMELGLAKLIKSSVGWAKGWALLALFMFAANLSIRNEVIFRAACIVCKQTVLLLPLFVLAWLIRLPQTLWVSPTELIGGPGPEFFSVSLYEIDPGSGNPRWRLFTPWAPALGMMGNLYFLCALEEKDPGYRRWGIAGSLLMILLSQSRLAILCALVMLALRLFLTSFRYPWVYLLLAPTSLLGGCVGGYLLERVSATVQAVKSARADSTRVREALGNIAVERWWNEAIVWGHGIVERGPHMVEYMPIGSHHTWYGLLFVKGLVGALALGGAFICSFIQLAPHINSLPSARLGVSLLLMLLMYTFGENLEILSYLFWPALILIGKAHQDCRKAVLQKARCKMQHPRKTGTAKKLNVMKNNKKIKQEDWHR